MQVQYYWIMGGKYEKIFVKIHVGKFKGFHHCKFDKKQVFATGSKKWTHKLRLTWNSLCCSKKTLPPKMYSYFNTFQYYSFHVRVSISSFRFQFYFRRPFHCVSSPHKVLGWGTSFQKKLFMGNKFFGENWWGELFHMGRLMIRLCHGGRSFTKCIFQ